MRLNNFYATDGEVVAIIRRLDVDADQKITYDEWIEAVKPSTTFTSSPTSRFEEEKRSSSPLRSSGFQDSPSKSKTL